MTDVLLKFLNKSPNLDYIIIDNNLEIVFASDKIIKFSSFPYNIKIGTDIRKSFPEFIGLEEVIQDILLGKKSTFELQDINLGSDNNFISFDIYLFLDKYQNFEQKYLVVIFEDTTQKHILTQQLTQVAKEYSLLLSQVSNHEKYIQTIINSLQEALFVTNKSGIIKEINQATEIIFGKNKQFFLNQNIVNILGIINNKSNCGDNLESLELEYFSNKNEKIYLEISSSSFYSEQEDETYFVYIARNITEKKKIEIKLIQQQQKEKLLNNIAWQIRQSLDLSEIMLTTAQEICQFLHSNKVIIYHWQNYWKIMAESGEDSCELFNQNRLNQPYLHDKYLTFYQQGKIYVQENNKSFLVLPILVNLKKIRHFQSSKLWGIIAAQSNNLRKWKTEEIEFLKQLKGHLAIAIEQGELYCQLQLANRELEQLAMIDYLTQLANRAAFNARLTMEWNRLAREKKPLSLILSDIDFFKQYNDTYGHLQGDECLFQVAQIFREITKRCSDLAARYGGEEFVIILPNTSRKSAIMMAEKLRSLVEELKIPHRKSLVSNFVTISIGVACMIPNYHNYYNQLIEAADQLLYQAKQQGRNRVCCSSE